MNNVMNEYFCTTASSHQEGSGYYKVIATDVLQARLAVHKHTNGKWSFLYKSLEDVHPLDRKCHGVLHGD